MRALPPTARPPLGTPDRRGAALLLSVLVLFVVIAIVFQISIGTATDARVARNDVNLTSMDLAIEASLFDVYEQLIADGEAAAEGGGADAGMAGGGALDGGAGGDVGAEGEAGDAPPPAADSKQDDWARPQRSEINEIELRVLVQDEDSKYNVLNMLSEDEEEAEEAFERVKRILDLCREGTRFDIDRGDAEQMASAMREYMLERGRSRLPRAALLSDDEEREEVGLPFSLRELIVLEPFEPYHFRDFRDEDGSVVHSLGSFLTVWTSPMTASDARAARTEGDRGGAAGGAEEAGAQSPLGQPGADEGDEPGGDGGGQEGGGQPPAGAAGASGGSGGYAVNVNTAPVAVLKGLVDDRIVPPRFWDDVVEYRNLEEEDDESDEYDDEPMYDEFGEEIIQRRFFDDLNELEETRSWGDLSSESRDAARKLLDTQSHVFSIFITARRQTGSQDDLRMALDGREAARREEEGGSALVRNVRAVVWRRDGEDGVELVPILRWEVLDYLPYEVQDYPDDWR